ncbi:MAG: RNA polymerase factor sigma-32 [Candidatus Binataceae bacterium]
MARKTAMPSRPRQPPKRARPREAEVHAPAPIEIEAPAGETEPERGGFPAPDSEVAQAGAQSSHGEDAPADAELEPSEAEPPSIADENDSGALVPAEPLGRYLAEIRRFPLLTREEEVKIARRYVRGRDPADAYRLVTANLRLVVKIAYEFSRAARNLLDLIQEGNVGLMEAVKNFDPEHGVRFPSYAVWWIRAYIYRYLINNWRLVKIGTTQAQRKLFFNLRKETEKLEAQGFKPQPLLLAHRLGVKESEVREMQARLGHSEVSLDQPAAPGGETRLIDTLSDSEGNPEAEIGNRETERFAREQVERFAATLEGKEREIFNSRLLAAEPPPLRELGVRLGISRERVRQIEARLKRRLKEFVERTAPGGVAGPF